MRGRWLCARCGLVEMGRPDDGRRRRTLRAAVTAFIGSGLAAKLLIGAAAMAAVGGVIVADPGINPAGQPDETTTTASSVPAPSPPGTEAPPSPGRAGVSSNPTGDSIPPGDPEFVAEVQAHAECVAEAARAFAEQEDDTEGGFDPGACGPPPGSRAGAPPGPPAKDTEPPDSVPGGPPEDAGSKARGGPSSD